MTDDPHAEGGPPTYTQAGARAPTHAERARTLVAANDTGALSTRQVDPDGYPYGSVATYAPDEAGAPLVLMSSMAAHAENLAEDQRCSLLVTASDAGGTGRLAGERATLIGDMVAVDEDDQEAATATYLEAHPGAFWAEFPDFSIHRLDIRAIRYIRGFGEMGWVEPEAYAAAEPDPLADREQTVVEHMNDDHREAMHTMVASYLDVAGEVSDVEMTSCDRYGFELRLTLAPADDAEGEPGLAFARLGFREPRDEASQARTAMVELVSDAREAGRPGS